MASYEFSYSRSALRALESLPANHRARVKARIDELANNPFPRGAKVLRGRTTNGEPVRRIRIGNFRVLYSIIDGSRIDVIDIGHRKDIYR